MKKIILTGGGTAGHVTPNLALLPYLLKDNIEVHYIGSINGIEKEIISKFPDIEYHSIRSGKFRRYFDMKNFTDPFRVAAGYFDALHLIKEISPDVVFSKGGFVSVPVVAAAHKCKIPVIAHESDITPGLANKISKAFATKICLTFPDTLKEIPAPKGIYTGSPIRAELYKGDGTKARYNLKFDGKPVLLMMGGSLGAKAINEALRAALEGILPKMNVIHICGKGNLSENLSKKQGYAQFEYVSDELADFFALSDYILSRAGSNSIHEFLALKKPMILIPLPLSASRGDQILNAKSFENRGFCITLNQENLSKKTLLDAIEYLTLDSSKMHLKMDANVNTDGTSAIINVIKSVMK